MRLSGGVEPAAVAPEKLAVQVARRLEHEIIERQWPVGEVLGSETALRDRFGVSRSILREAVRLLEHSRMAQMRQGPGGGLVVCSPDPRPAIRALVISLEYVGASVEQVVYARSVFERMAVDTVAESLTESGVRELRVSASGQRCGHAEDFHTMLGHLSGNPVLELFIDILVRLTSAYSHRAREISGGDVDSVRRESAHRHLVIADAVVAGDTGRAQGELVRHLDDISSWLGRFVDPIPGERTATRPMDPDPDERPREQKLAVSVAGRIHDDIVREGRNVGEVLGSEADFLARYGVSRSIFREAIRILEHYSVARMRRGPGGGLVVLEPDPTSSVRTVALYLSFRGMTAAHLRDVRVGVELACLTSFMRSRSIDRDKFWTDPSSNSRKKCCHCSAEFRTRIETLTGDRVMMLLRSVLATLWNEYGDSPRPSEPCCATEPDPAVAQELGAIVDAMVDGDEELARYRMRNHLRGRTGW